MNKNLEKV